jgi:RND family efflux transporter MFP subunit
MNTRAIVLLLLLGIVPALFFTTCGGPEAGEDQEGLPESPPQQIVPVTVREVQTEPYAEMLQVTGYVQALYDIIVSTEEGGVLKEWKTPKGRRVKKGATIAIMNDDVLRPMYETALAQYRRSELNFVKQQQVFQQEAISELQFKTAEYTRDAARAQADLAQARLERTRIKSPVYGILDDRFVDEGELAPPGSPVARIVRIDRVKALLYVPERYAGTITYDATVHITVSAFPSETFSGTVSYVGASVMEDNRSIPVEVLLANPERKLKPDMIVKAQLLQSAPRKAIIIEERFVQQLDHTTFVVYVEENGKAKRRVVTLGGRIDHKVEITSGLAPGDRLITSGHQGIVDGQIIEIAQSAE